MTDLLIRDVPNDVVKAIDQKAAKLGISRAEFVRSCLSREAHRASVTVTHEDMQRFSRVFEDINDEEIMRGAWE